MFHDKYEIDKNDSELGQGAHAIVKKIHLKENESKCFAVKIQRTGDTEVIN